MEQWRRVHRLEDAERRHRVGRRDQRAKDHRLSQRERRLRVQRPARPREGVDQAPSDARRKHGAEHCVAEDHPKVGKELAKKLKLQGADKILSEIFEQFREN